MGGVRSSRAIPDPTEGFDPDSGLQGPGRSQQLMELPASPQSPEGEREEGAASKGENLSVNKSRFI